MARKTKEPEKVSAEELSEDDLDQVQGGGTTQFPAGVGGVDLKKPQLNIQGTGEEVPQIDNWVPDVDNW